MAIARADWVSRLWQGLSVLIVAVSGVANAQYFFAVDVPPIGSPDCNVDSVHFGSPAALRWNVPPLSSNEVILVFVNGVALDAIVQTQTPTSGTSMATLDFSPLGSPATPYTVVVQAFPAINGDPVGTGAQVHVQCSTLGPGQGTAVFSSVAAPANYQGLWWRTGGSEPFWGINFAHSGDQIFGTWYTYDTSGKIWWLSMLANRASPASNVYTGPIYVDSGSPFNNFVGPGTPTQVGTGMLTFTDANNGSFSYTVNTTTPPTTQSKAIARFDLGTGPQPTCTYRSTTPNFAAATNYQDLWWVANNAESGWGINFAHQGDSVFATWYTYDVDGTPLWLSVLATRVGNVYTGTLYLTSGPRFDAYDPAKVAEVQAGTATLTFADGNHATFGYATNGVGGLPVANQSKQVTRFPFSATGGTMCQ